MIIILEKILYGKVGMVIQPGMDGVRKKVEFRVGFSKFSLGSAFGSKKTGVGSEVFRVSTDTNQRDKISSRILKVQLRTIRLD